MGARALEALVMPEKLSFGVGSAGMVSSAARMGRSRAKSSLMPLALASAERDSAWHSPDATSVTLSSSHVVLWKE